MNEIVTQKEFWDREAETMIGIGSFDYVKEPLPILKKMRESATSKVIISFPRAWTWRVPLRGVRLYCVAAFTTPSF